MDHKWIILIHNHMLFPKTKSRMFSWNITLWTIWKFTHLLCVLLWHHNVLDVDLFWFVKCAIPFSFRLTSQLWYIYSTQSGIIECITLKVFSFPPQESSKWYTPSCIYSSNFDLWGYVFQTSYISLHLTSSSATKSCSYS